MKNLSIILFLFFARNLAISQDIEICEKIVLQTYEALNNKNAEMIQSHLAEDFSTAGQTGDIAKLVLPELFRQLNTKTSNIKKISEVKTDVLTLVYEADFDNMGKQTSTFVFNNKNQLQTLELLELQIKTLAYEDLKVFKNDENYFTVPFKMVGNLISIQVSLDGVVRTFLVDNGAPILILNSSHIKKDTLRKLALGDAVGAGGSISEMNVDSIQSLEFGGIKLDKQQVITMDLSHLEAATKTTFYGLLGYEIYKDYDLLFDYKKKTLTFIKPEATSDYLLNKYKSKKQIEIPIEMGAHIAIVDGYINGKKYSLGLDCGAESNLYDIKLQEELKVSMSNLKTDSLLGADKNVAETLSGKLNSLVIGGVEFKKTKTSLGDISHLNNGYGLKLDGMIGYNIISKQPTLFCYKNKKLIFLK